MLVPAQGGTHRNGRRTWGDPVIVDPWGAMAEVVRGDGEGVVLADVDPAQNAAVRQQLPAMADRQLWTSAVASPQPVRRRARQPTAANPSVISA